MDKEIAKEIYSDGLTVGQELGKKLILNNVAHRLAFVLNSAQMLLEGVDNGHCKICDAFRVYNTRGNIQPCENKKCFSYEINNVLDEYEKELRNGTSE